MILVYLFVGLLASILSALPLGASNIAVINTTLKQNTKQALKIAITAGVAEVILSYYALHSNQMVKTFFENNTWVQILIIVILFAVGGFLFFKKQPQSKLKKQGLTKSKYATGFLLGILNPPVLMYWVIAFGVLNNNHIMLSLKSSFLILFVFFLGVYIGKLLTLYGYSKMSVAIKNKVDNTTLVLNKVTGVLLLVISFAQAFQLYLV